MGHACHVSLHPKLPAVGDPLLFVADCDGPPVQVTVTAVHMGDLEDLNVWRWRTDPATGNPVLVLDQDGAPVPVDWPNPNIDLRGDDGAVHTTRQIRHRGSPGWTWDLRRPFTVGEFYTRPDADTLLGGMPDGI